MPQVGPRGPGRPRHPTLTVLISGLVTLFGLMFLAGEASTAIGTFANWLLSSGGAFAGLVLGGLFLPSSCSACTKP